jgi:hypothetical protein
LVRSRQISSPKRYIYWEALGMDAEFIKLFHLCVKVTREQLGRPLREKNASTFAKVGLASSRFIHLRTLAVSIQISGYSNNHR